MSDWEELKNFSGNIPLFPLPNVVLFPNVILPLHIFEPRYRKMLEETMDGEGLIGMSLLRKGWEKNYFGKPSIHGTICIGKILDCEPLPDGKYNILLKGICRAKVIGELENEPYRIAQVEPLEDQFPLPSEKMDKLVTSILDEYQRFSLATAKPAGQDNQPEVRFDLPPEVISDLVASMLNLDSLVCQSLLEELQVDKRLQMLSQTLRMKNQLIEISKQLKPRIRHGFSIN